MFSTRSYIFTQIRYTSKRLLSLVQNLNSLLSKNDQINSIQKVYGETKPKQRKKKKRKNSQSDRACVIIFARCKIIQKETYRLDVCYHLKSTSKSLTTLDVISTFFLGNHVTSRDMKRKTTVFLASSVKGWSCKFLPELHPCPSIILARKLTVQAKEILFCTHQL